jgi:hypothetical protein
MRSGIVMVEAVEQFGDQNLRRQIVMAGVSSRI